MKTDDLINALSADVASGVTPMRHAWALATIAAILCAGAVFTILLTPRADFWQVASTPRFIFKFVFSATVALSGLAVLRHVSRPGAKSGTAILLSAICVLTAGVLAELLSTAPHDWSTRAVGHNSLLCLLLIPVMGAGPLAALLLALRHGATTRPRLAGALCGFAAGGIGAFFYAMHCVDDSPLFVAIWYCSAMAILSFLGILLGPKIARW